MANPLPPLPEPMADLYDVLQQNEIDLIGDALRVVRDSAWWRDVSCRAA